MTNNDEPNSLRLATNLFGSLKAAAGLAVIAVLANGAVGTASAFVANRSTVTRAVTDKGYGQPAITKIDVVGVGFYGCQMQDVVKYTVSAIDDHDNPTSVVVCRDLLGHAVVR